MSNPNDNSSGDEGITNPQRYFPALSIDQTENSNNMQLPISESLPLLWFMQNNDLIIENRTSEPRDLLMSERTLLAWVKCGTLLCMVSALMIIDFRLDTTKPSNMGSDRGKRISKYSFAISIVLCVLGLGCFTVASIAYFKALYSYKHQKIQTYDITFLTAYLAFLCLSLFGIGILFMVKG
ncbi:hypothetical protein FOA43_000679 [Brettanomyces nanus]|uniref:DUF202 domain-containing protein n=1 Tax=Eeniella nana TaxID=13502 RepID=A0A875S0G5_EENNA|nr:uncharacterized protein FOA43_000679 [Brettanomyces nanus]QPG73369.1 hypothetical protein FOA43_000679 [Brettanomyces nanus]